MARESNLQTRVLNHLKKQPSVVFAVKMPADNPAIPNATSDVLFLLDGGGWGFIEVKAEYPYKKDGNAKSSAFRPGQQEFVARMNGYYYASICWPENWDDIKKELEQII